jgi:hypothetical protein
MEKKEFQFNGTAIRFEVENKNVLINATEMANVFGKKPDDFLKTEQTEAFINECCKDENYYELLGLKKEVQVESIPLETESQEENSPLETGVQVENIRLENLEDRKKQFLKVMHGGRNNGTWMHRVLAVKFAAWLDPAFELWVFRTVDCLIFGSYKEDEETLRAIAGIQDQITEKEKELKNLPILKEIEDLRKSEQREKRKFELHKKMRISGFRTIFSEKEMSGK